MRIDPNDAVSEITGVLAHKSSIEGGMSGVRELLALYHACISRLAPPGSSYMKTLLAMQPIPLAAPKYVEIDRVDQLAGTLRALQSDYAAGRTRSFEELVHASLFEDLLEQADELSGSGYHRAGIILAGCTLEEHLRKLAPKHSVAVKTPDGKWQKANVVNIDLAKAGAYPKTEQTHVEAHLKDRNDAAHPDDPANPAVFDRPKVERMVTYIRDFISRYPA